MPPARKKKKKNPQQEAAAASSSLPLTPKDAHFARLKRAMADHKCKGQILVVGIQDEGKEDEDEGEESTLGYSEEQIATCRHILVTDSREKAITAGIFFASLGLLRPGDDYALAMFDTTTGTQVVAGIPGAVKKALKEATPAAKFDALFGLTHGLKQFGAWMRDNECSAPGGELQKVLKLLGKAWLDLLKKSDADLGIDAEFTRPGIESYLESLQLDFEACEATKAFPFKWRP